MGDELSQTERSLMGELLKLSQQISSFVVRAMGADAEQAEPITPKEEFELGVRLAELGAVLRVRARERGGFSDQRRGRTKTDELPRGSGDCRDGRG